MPDAMTRLDLQAIGRQYVIDRASKIDPKQVDILGSDVNIFVGSTAQIAFAIVLQLAQRINALLLDGAQDEDLDRYAYDRYQLPRKGASAAVGQVRVYRTTFASGAGSIPIGTRLISLTGFEYVTTSQISFTATDTEATGYVKAVQAGKASEVGKNAIRRFSDITLLWDQSLQVNNDETTAGGEDAETDDDFRARIRDYWNTARRGTLAAIEFGAKQVDGVVSAQSVEALTPGLQPARVVVLYIADSSGVASKALGNSVRQNLDEYRAGGIAVITSTSQPQIVEIQLKLSFKALTDTTTLTDAIIAAVVEYVNSLPVNGPLYKAELSAVLARFVPDGLIINDSTIVAPTGDIYPDPGKTLRMNVQNLKVSLWQAFSFTLARSLPFRLSTRFPTRKSRGVPVTARDSMFPLWSEPPRLLSLKISIVISIKTEFWLRLLCSLRLLGKTRTLVAHLLISMIQTIYPLDLLGIPFPVLSFLLIGQPSTSLLI